MIRGGSWRALWALAMAISLGAAAAEARTFAVLRSATDTWTIIDPLTVERLPGGVVRRTWVVGVQKSIVSGDLARPGYVRTLVDYDCVNRQSRWRTFSAYDRSGALLMSKDNPSLIWSAPTTPAVQAEFGVVCEGRSGDSAISADGIARVVIALMASWDPPSRPAGGTGAKTPSAPKPKAP